MREETITRKIYSFDELSDETKDEAHANYLRNGDYWFWGDEALATIKEVENLFHITLKNWFIDSYRPEYPDVHFDEYWWEYSEMQDLSGNRARAFLWNNFGHVLTSPRYYGKKCLKHSRFVTERVYDGTCPLTGIYFDNCALDPLAYFCFGVEWDETEKKRVMTKDRTLVHDNATTVENVIRDCVYEMFSAFNKDVEYAESMEAFAETCKANGYEFLEDGTIYV